MYFFYLDESGISSISAKSVKESRYFVLGALALHESNWRAVDDYLTQVKQAFFPAVDFRQIEFKSGIIKSALTQASTPASPWPSLDKEKVLLLIDELYSIFEKIPFTMMFVAIDKLILSQKYTKPYSPYSVAFALLWQQAARFLRSLNPPELGIFVVDEHQEAQKRLASFQRIAESLDQRSPRSAGLDIVIERPFFVNSKEFQVIQLADLCVYNARRAVSSGDYDYEYFKRIEPHIFKPTTLDSQHGVVIYPARFTLKNHAFGL